MKEEGEEISKRANSDVFLSWCVCVCREESHDIDAITPEIHKSK